MAKREAAMTRMEFREALQKLGWKPPDAAHPLGLSIRQVFRYMAGDTPIPASVANLVRHLEQNGSGKSSAKPPGKSPAGPGPPPARRRKRGRIAP